MFQARLPRPATPLKGQVRKHIPAMPPVFSRHCLGDPAFVGNQHRGWPVAATVSSESGDGITMLDHKYVHVHEQPSKSQSIANLNLLQHLTGAASNAANLKPSGFSGNELKERPLLTTYKHSKVKGAVTQ